MVTIQTQIARCFQGCGIFTDFASGKQLVQIMFISVKLYVPGGPFMKILGLFKFLLYGSLERGREEREGGEGGRVRAFPLPPSPSPPSPPSLSSLPLLPPSLSSLPLPSLSSLPPSLPHPPLPLLPPSLPLPPSLSSLPLLPPPPFRGRKGRGVPTFIQSLSFQTHKMLIILLMFT